MKTTPKSKLLTQTPGEHLRKIVLDQITDLQPNNPVVKQVTAELAQMSEGFAFDRAPQLEKLAIDQILTAYTQNWVAAYLSETSRRNDAPRVLSSPSLADEVRERGIGERGKAKRPRSINSPWSTPERLYLEQRVHITHARLCRAIELLARIQRLKLPGSIEDKKMVVTIVRKPYDPNRPL